MTQKQIRIIYIDDDLQMAGLLPRVLALAEIKVVAVCTSAEELLAIKDTPVYEKAEVLVTDVQLPKMTGVELARHLRTTGEKRPILAMSAWSEEAKWELAEINVAYLQKPYEFEALERTIKRLAKELRDEI